MLNIKLLSVPFTPSVNDLSIIIIKKNHINRILMRLLYYPNMATTS